MDFLEHEMRVSSLLELGDGQFKTAYVKMSCFIVESFDFQRFTFFNNSNFPVVQIRKIIGIVDD